MSGGGQAAAPQASPAEQAAQQAQADNLAQQTEILKRQDRTQNLLAPFLYSQLNLKPTMDASGNITGFEDTTTDAQKQSKSLQDSVNLEGLQREQNALEGKLPVDQSLTDQLDQQEQDLHNQLAQQFGPGYETSDPGIRSLKQFNISKNMALDAARRGDLQTASTLVNNNTSTQTQNRNATLNALMGVNQSPLQTAQGFGGAAQGYGTAIQGFNTRAGINASIAQSNASNSQSGFNTLVSAGAGLAGAAAGAGAIWGLRK